MREVNDAVELRDEFILCQGDIVCNADLSDALKMHYRAK
jgi:NDP-sugar pyrophosphorylase family protein